MLSEEQNGSLALSSRERQLKSMLISGDIQGKASIQENARAERFSAFDRSQQTDKLGKIFAACC